MAASAREQSHVWEYFLRLERNDRKYSKCQLCYAELSGHLAGNAKKHLLARHGSALVQEVNTSDSGISGRIPNRLKKVTAELNDKKNALLEELHLLTGHQLADARNPELTNETIRTPRSGHIDQHQHREQNKLATRRWRKRTALKSQLEKEIVHLECLRNLATNQMAAVTQTLNRPYNEAQLLDFAFNLNAQLHLMVSEIFVLARRRISGVVVLNYQRPPTENRKLQEMVHRSKDAQILNWFYTCGSIVGLFESEDGGAAGSCIVELFDRYSSTLNPRVYACGVILSTDEQRIPNEAPRNAIIVAVSKEHGTVSFVHNGRITTTVGFDALLRELLCSLQSELRRTPVTDNSTVSNPVLIAQAERFITTRCEVKFFNPHVHADWYRQYCVESRMELHEFMNKRDVLSFMTEFLRFERWRHYFNLPEGCPDVDAEDIVLPGDEDVIRYIGYRAEMDLVLVHEEKLVGFIIEFGCKRLGGVFMGFNMEHRTVALLHPFLHPQILRSGYMHRFLAALLKAQGYHRWFDKLEAGIPRHVVRLFEPIMAAMCGERLGENATMLGFDSDNYVRYSFPISSFIRMFSLL